MTKWKPLIQKAFQVGIKPDEFWRMTLREFFWLIEADEMIKDEMNWLRAHFTAVVANAPYKKAVKVNDFFKTERERRQDPEVTKEEKQRRFERAKKKMGVDVIPIKSRR